MNERSPRILILIPAYNASRYLPQLISRIKKSAGALDVLIINDGSTDNTAKILPSLGVQFLENNPNEGKGYTLKRGFEYAIRNDFDFVVTIDADLQHLPEEIPGLLAEIDKADLVIGTRTINLRIMPFARWLTNNLTSIMISIFSGQRIRDSQSGYRLLSVKVLVHTRVQSVKYDYESELLFQTGALCARIGEAPISTVYEGSHSYINPLVDTGRFIKLIWRRILL